MNRFLKFGLIAVLVSSGTLGFSFGKASASERVHLSPFMVNVIEDGGKKTGQLPISVYLDLKDVESARLCLWHRTQNSGSNYPKFGL